MSAPVGPPELKPYLLSPPEAGGEAGPADQEAREAGPGGRQPGPEWRQRVAEVPPHERDSSMSSTPPSSVSQPPPLFMGVCSLLNTPSINIILVPLSEHPPVPSSFILCPCFALMHLFCGAFCLMYIYLNSCSVLCRSAGRESAQSA